jgi:hypothetical protein
MTLDQFMIWRFRNVEGVLDGVKTWNIDTCVFENGSTIKYDLKNETMTIDNKNTIFGKSETIPVKNCNKDKLIKDYGFVERLNNRHGLSYTPEETGV